MALTGDKIPRLVFGEQCFWRRAGTGAEADYEPGPSVEADPGSPGAYWVEASEPASYTFLYAAWLAMMKAKSGKFDAIKILVKPGDNALGVTIRREDLAHVFLSDNEERYAQRYFDLGAVVVDGAGNWDPGDPGVLEIARLAYWAVGREASRE